LLFRNEKTSITPSKRLQGAGRPLKDKELDEKLIRWVQDQRAKKLRVSRAMITNKAKSLSADDEFKVAIFIKVSSF
jgi:Tc5 transposase DNA-binding domain